MNDYKKLYDRVGKLCGWDFSNLDVISKGEKWDFYEEVLKFANKKSVLLDIGVGGGKKILKIAPKVKLIIGIDHSSAMITTAKKNLSKTKINNVRFQKMEAKKLEFPNESFDVVADRHCDFFAKEVYRVLRKGGHFLTQQVSEGDKLNIKEAFKRGQTGSLKKEDLLDLADAGFSNIKSFDYNAIEYYKTSKDLLFLLKHTPTIPNFGKRKSDLKTFDSFVQRNMTKKGIKTNSKRFLIIATK